MSNKSGYKKQQNLSLQQFLAEASGLIVVFVSLIVSRTILVFVDLLDALGNTLRAGVVTVLSKKLTKDLKYQYNYGVGKIEAIASLFCDGIMLVGLIMSFALSIYLIIFPKKPSDLVIAVVGVKMVNVSFDVFFLAQQKRILKTHHSAISETNYAAALASLLFDSVTLVSLLLIWLLRNTSISGYISPVISIFVSFYLMVGCFKRIKQALVQLTDKTLPEEDQIKMLTVLSRFYDRFSQFHSINSHKSGDLAQIDLNLSFNEKTTFEEIVDFKKEIKKEFEKELGQCSLNIIVVDEN